MRRRRFSFVLGLSVVAGGCSGASSDRPLPLPVFAAASLTESFEAIEVDFEQAHPQVDVQLNFAGSQVLRLQLEQGAAAAVFASANEDHIRALEGAQLVAPPKPFATNTLVLAVPSEGSEISSFGDLPQAEHLVIGDEAAPIGMYTERLFDAAESSLGSDFVDAVRARIASRETNVRLVRAKAELGEADAVIVYRSEVFDGAELRTVELPEDLRVRVTYFASPVLGSSQRALADEFIAYLQSPAARRRLGEHGFDEETP